MASSQVTDMAKLKVLATIAALGIAVLVQSGCATSDDGAPTEETSAAQSELADGTATSSFTNSFWNTCNRPNWYAKDSPNGRCIWLANADGCKMFNGHYGGYTEYRGCCLGDVSNCNGKIVCQTHCP